MYDDRFLRRKNKLKKLNGYNRDSLNCDMVITLNLLPSAVSIIVKSQDPFNEAEYIM